MTQDIPPLTNRSLGEPIFYYRESLVSVGELLATAGVLAEQFPPGVELVNLCGNRFHFLLGFVAAILAGGKNILPPNKQPETLARLAGTNSRRALVDADLELPGWRQEAVLRLHNINVQAADKTLQVPVIPADDSIVEVFTSGSTGAPKKLLKTWRILAGTGLKLSERLDLHPGELCDLLATVPCQHMYGLETSVVMPLLSPLVCDDHTPFYPEDVCARLAAKTRPVRMITTPVHMRALVYGKLELSRKVTQIISATAPLAEALAKQAERVLADSVYEIFGFSEAGSVATRRTTSGPDWTLLEGFQLSQRQNSVLLASEHLPKAEHFPDNLELLSNRRFRFISRAGDYLNIGGKRMSLNDLVLKLLAVPGVSDAHLYMPEQENARPGGWVVCSRSVREILAELSREVDPVFLPRPLKKRDSILRNATGKVTGAEMKAMLDGVQ